MRQPCKVKLCMAVVLIKIAIFVTACRYISGLRPIMRFSDIPGHTEIKHWLRQLVDNDKIPHALLLEGPEGIGKLAMARAMIQYIYCEHRTSDGDSCGRCQSCTLLNSLSHLDSMYSYPVVKDDDNPISDKYLQQWKRFLAEEPLYAGLDRWTATFTKTNARPLIYVTEANDLIHKLSFQARQSRYKSVIVWLPERLNEEAANKLLKLIEEPYPDTLLLFVSNEPQLILPTIYSRLQRVPMRRQPDDIIASWLQDKRGLSVPDSRAIAHLADGSFLEADLQLSVSSDTKRYFELFKSLMRLAYARKVAGFKDWAAELADMGRESEIKFYTYAARLIRESFVYNFQRPHLNYLNPEEEAFSKNFARFITVNNVEGIIRVIDNAIIEIGGNGNGKAINFDVAMRIMILLRKSN